LNPIDRGRGRGKAGNPRGIGRDEWGPNLDIEFSWGRGAGKEGGNTISRYLQYYIFGYPLYNGYLIILVPNI